MPDIVIVKVQGLETIDRALRELPVTVQDRLLGDGLMAAGDVFKRGIAEKIRSRTGRTVADLAVQVQVKPGEEAGAAAVGGTKGTRGRGFVLNFLERGTKPHVIPKRTRRGGRKTKRPSFAGKVFSRVHHPGTHAQAPMRLALADKGQEAIHAFGQTLWDGIRDTAAKLAGPT